MSKQTVNIGTTANDGTGSTLRAAMDMINDNFNELYIRMSPVAGTANEAIINAVKYFEVNEPYYGELFFISEIIAGTLADGHYTYTVDIFKGSSLSDTGDLIMRYTTSSPTSPKTGLELITLAEYDGSGHYGRMVIDWSALTLGTDYRADDWTEGGIMAVNLGPSYGLKGAGQFDVITATSGETLDGSKYLYVFNPASDAVHTLAAAASVVGRIKMKNISANTVTIHRAGSETFDGNNVTGIVVGAGLIVAVEVYDGNFIITEGAYVEESI